MKKNIVIVILATIGVIANAQNPGYHEHHSLGIHPGLTEFLILDYKF